MPNGAGIYLLKDKKSGLHYVGSSKSVKTRIVAYYRPDSPDYKKILFQELDPINFSMEILELVPDERLLLEREQYWIDKLNTNYPNGLNVFTANIKNTKQLYCSEYKAYKKHVSQQGACWHLFNYLKRYLFYMENTNSIPTKPSPYLREMKRIKLRYK